jgi:nucleotide-binding universal stress UspA family protein
MVQVRTILVPTDFSSCASAAFEHAVEFARRFDAKILLLHVMPNLARALPDLHPLPAEWVETARKEARERLAKDAGSIKELAVQTELREGAPHDGILAAAAAAKADMIVIGTHGRSGFTRMMLGSVAERVVRSSPIPVYMVPSRE